MSDEDRMVRFWFCSENWLSPIVLDGPPPPKKKKKKKKNGMQGRFGMAIALLMNNTQESLYFTPSLPDFLSMALLS